MINLMYKGLLSVILLTSMGNGSIKENTNPSTPIKIATISTDPTYGISEKNPVKVGGFYAGIGPNNEREYLNSLAGPNGEQVKFYRAGSCCHMKSESNPSKYVILDNYRVCWEGSKDTISVFINMYEFEELKAPMGFSIKNRKSVRI